MGGKFDHRTRWPKVLLHHCMTVRVKSEKIMLFFAQAIVIV